MQNHTYKLEEMLQDTTSRDALENIAMKEGEIPSHIAPQPNTYFKDTDRTTEDDNYPWLDRDYKRLNMKTEITECKVNLKGLRFTKEQKVKPHDLIKEHCDAVSL